MGQKNAIALNEKNSNEEPTDGVRPIHIVLSKTRVVHSTVFGSMIFYIAHRIRVLIEKVKDRRRQRDLNSLAWRGSSTVILDH